MNWPGRGNREGKQAWMRERTGRARRAKYEKKLLLRRMYKRRRPRTEGADTSDLARRFPVFWFCWRAQCKLVSRHL